MGVIFILCIVLAFAIPIYITVRNNQKYKEQLEQNNALAMENNAIHLSGLPATGREVCSIIVKDTGITISNNRQSFNIPTDKIVGSVANQETRDVQTVQTTTKKKPSVGKAVVGGALFGPAGAVIGGTSGKAKSTSNVQTRTEIVKLYLTIDYLSDGETKQIMFEGRPSCRFYQIQNAINSRVSGVGTQVL